MFAERQRFECGSNLIYLLHSGSSRTAAKQNDDISRGNHAVLDGVDGGFFCNEYFCRADVPVYTVFVDEGGVDGSALDNGAFWRKVSHWKAHGRGKSAKSCPIRSH